MIRDVESLVLSLHGSHVAHCMAVFDSPLSLGAPRPCAPGLILNAKQYIVFNMKNVTSRMSDEELRLLDKLAKERGQSRSEAIREAVRRGAREELVRVALERYRDGDVGMRGAAEIAGLTVAEMMHEANERGILTNYAETDLESDVEALR
jgi:predicted HTH domain antitoxin